MDLPLYATEHTREFYAREGIDTTLVRKLHEEGEPNVGTLMADGSLDLVLAIPKGYARTSDDASAAVRRCAARFAVPLVANIQLASSFVKALEATREDDLQAKAWDEYI